MNDFDNKAKFWDNDPEKHKRAKLFADKISAGINRNDKSAMEYGCGTGLVSFCLNDKFKNIALCDSSQGMIDTLKMKITESGIGNMKPVLCDLEKDDMNEKFDVIYSLMAMHHVINIEKVLDKFRKMLSENGSLFIADLEKEDGSFHGTGFKGHNGFDRDMLVTFLENAGFNTVEYEVFNTMKKKSTDGLEREYKLFFLHAICR